MQRCYELYQTSDDAEVRRSAVELLSAVADERALPWIAEFLNDPDEGVQNRGIGVLDQYLWGGGGEPANCANLLALAEQHRNANVRERVQFIRNYLRERSPDHQSDRHDS